MKVLLFSSPSHAIKMIAALNGTGDQVIVADDIPSMGVDWIVSFGHRKKISAETIAKVQGRALNIHISYLPWNRGADPNFWSWHNETPKGVSIHLMDDSIDTGPLLRRTSIKFSPEKETLATSYRMLNSIALDLFVRSWPAIKAGELDPIKQDPLTGSFHRKADIESVWHLFPKGWDSSCAMVEALGRKWRKERETVYGIPAG